MNKYHARKTEVDGYVFDSRAEARRWSELKLLEDAGEISVLERQIPFEVQVNGQHICKYYADFVYIENGERVVEDVKSAPTRTPEYRLKKKLVEAIHGIKIREVQ